MSPLRIYRWFDGPPQHRTGIRVLQCALALAIVIRSLTELPYAAWLFGPHGIGEGLAPPGYGPLGIVLDAGFGSAATVVALFCVQLAAALALLAGFSTRAATVVLLLTYLSFEVRFPEITDGGDNLARLSLMYMVLLLPARGTAAPGSGRAFVHNLGVALMFGQVLAVYFTAGIMKAQGQAWMQGTALYMVSQVEWISLPGVRDMFKHAIFAVPAAYVTVIWQITFPVGVCSRLKLAFLGLGVLFHLGIGLFMGLTTFSLVMMGAEAFLITDDEYEELRRRARSVVVSLRGMSTRPIWGLAR